MDTIKLILLNYYYY